jgi:His-Xaa-Ser system protein HxsD
MEVDFDLRVFGINAVQRAALKYTNLASFDFHIEGDRLRVSVVSANQGIEIDAEQFIARFRNEVLDQHLRERIAAETEQERNLILSYAFLNTKLIRS